MDALLAHGYFTLIPVEQRERFPHFVDHPDFDIWPSSQAAAASLSGQLEDCRTEADLKEAVEHFETLFNSETIDRETYANEIVSIVGEVFKLGKSYETN